MPANKDSEGGWRSFLWNSERKEFLGRTGSSWFKIFIFYVVFYGCLAGIFIGTIQAMLLTLSNYKPTYQDRVAPPGLSHTPRSEKGELQFAKDDPASYSGIVADIDKLLANYDLLKQEDMTKFENCGGETAGDYKERGALDGEGGVRRACRFDRDWLGSCSGSDPSYGFKDGKPCLIVKLNRIVFYRPRAPANGSVPAEAQPRSQGNTIPMYCNTRREEDKGKVTDIQYFGFQGGFPMQYYPYYGKALHPQYLQPLVAVKFNNLTYNEDLRIECKVFGANIQYSEKDRYQGRFEVKLHVKSS